MCVQSPNGRLIASGAIDGIINLFDLQTGKLLHTLEGKHEWLSLGLSATLCIYLVMVLRYTEIYAALETYNIINKRYLHDFKVSAHVTCICLLSCVARSCHAGEVSLLLPGLPASSDSL